MKSKAYKSPDSIQVRAIAAVARMQEQSLRLGNDKLSLAEINAIIKAVRKARRP